MKPKILIITSTQRNGRIGHTVANWYKKEAEKLAPETEFKLLDMAELDLSIFSEAIPPLQADGYYTPAQQKLADEISAADGYVFVTGEYNKSIPAPLKNLFDHLSEREWQHKAAAFVGYGVHGAFFSISHLMHVLVNFRVMSVNDTVTIDTIWDALDEKGTPKPQHIRGDMERQLKELLWWTKKLRSDV
jgi:NAD(P)H-dependent FMN reductase